MSRTTYKWGVITVISLALVGLLYFPSRHNKSSELFASDKQTLTTDTLHPVEQFTVNGQAKTIVEAFKQAGKIYYPEDHITAFPDPSLGLGSVITVARALPIEIQDGKRKVAIRTWQDSLEKILAENKLELGDEDRITPALTTPLTTITAVSIVRVARTNVQEKETIQFQVIEQDDNTMWRGETKVTQQGSNGERTKTYLVIREDGIQISKTLTSNIISTPVTNKIIRVGTKLKIGKTLTGKATWYENSYGTKVAMDVFKKGTTVRITNLATGKSIIVTNDGCICGASNVLVDLSPDYFQQLGGKLGDGVMPSIKVEEVLN